MRLHDRSGFALITVLWLLATLSVVVGLSMAATRIGNQTSSNRLVLTRGRWAAEACLAVTQARWRQHRLADTATLSLGRHTYCAWTIDDPSARINLNTSDQEVLAALGLSDAFIRTVIERRRAGPIEDVGQVASAPGFDSSITPLVTVVGPGLVNLTNAPRRVLLALPGLGPEAVDRILYDRAVGRAPSSLNAIAAGLSPSARDALLNRYADLARLTTFSAPQLVVRTSGWVQPWALRAIVEDVVVPLPERLAVVQRRMW